MASLTLVEMSYRGEPVDRSILPASAFSRISGAAPASQSLRSASFHAALRDLEGGFISAMKLPPRLVMARSGGGGRAGTTFVRRGDHVPLHTLVLRIRLRLADLGRIVLADRLHVEHHAAVLMPEEVAVEHVLAGELRIAVAEPDVAVARGVAVAHRHLARDRGGPIPVPGAAGLRADVRAPRLRIGIAPDRSGLHVPGVVEYRQSDGVLPD